MMLASIGLSVWAQKLGSQTQISCQIVLFVQIKGITNNYTDAVHTIASSKLFFDRQRNQGNTAGIFDQIMGV